MGLATHGRRGALLAVCVLALCGVSQAALIVNVDSGGAIADEDTTNFTFTINQSGTIQEVELRLAIAHPYDPDLTILLKSPANTTVTVFDQVIPKGSVYANFQDTYFDDDGDHRLTDTDTPPYAGIFQLNGTDNLSAFVGEDIQGTWTLIITDNEAEDEGYLFRSGDTEPESWNGMIGTQLILTIPEPVTAGLLLLGGVLLMLRRRRRAA